MNRDRLMCPCGDDWKCDGTYCVEKCPLGTTNCFGFCRDLAHDPAHCGACAQGCGVLACFEGTCVEVDEADAGTDAGIEDVGVDAMDAGVLDVGVPDAAQDSGPADVGPDVIILPDAGPANRVLEAEDIALSIPWEPSLLGARVRREAGTNLDPSAAPDGVRIGVITFRFEGLQANEPHYVWIRYRSDGPGSNSVHVSTTGPGGVFERFDVTIQVAPAPEDSAWSNDVILAMTDASGRLNISLKNREYLFEIDSMLVTRDSAFDPDPSD